MSLPMGFPSGSLGLPSVPMECGDAYLLDDLFSGVNQEAEVLAFVITSVIVVVVMVQELVANTNQRLGIAVGIEVYHELKLSLIQVHTAWTRLVFAVSSIGQDQTRWWVKERSLIWYDYYLQKSYDDSRWTSTLKMTRGVFKFIVTKLAPTMSKADTRFRNVVSADVRIAATLYQLATGSNYFNTIERFGVGFSTIQEFMPEVVMVIIRKLGPLFLKWQRGEAMAKVSQKFKHICGLPNIHGAMDGSFIRIRAPQHLADNYFNKKWYTSLVLHGIVDTNVAFLDISYGFPRSIHDYRVLRCSCFMAKVNDGEILQDPVLTINDGYSLRHYVLADSGY
ncbi:hypothetical protein R1flu_024745 [Riccia fluitans]|uniref:DDE Tnp4 domain-containing protein n=1 Tax=Riccia fluitans TaxID=41844 RepID=A0ABD1XWR1_9MARC